MIWISGYSCKKSAGRAPSGEYWRKLSQISWHELFYAPFAKGLPFFLELKERILQELKPDFLLIDSRTGITEIGGIATSILPDKLVCLLLNNRENLEGARAVLQSIARSSKRGKQVEVIPVLARIPEMADPKLEHKVVQEVQEFLNQKADLIEDTLDISDLSVLHSEPGLQVAEHLHVGAENISTDSELLRDYLRLFVRLIPLDVIRPHIGALVEHAKAALFEDPDGAQAELENLAQYFGHPELYRELLKLYRVRNTGGNIVLRTAERLWNINPTETDPLIWEAVSKHFREVEKESDTKESGPSLRFVEETWRSSGAKDLRVGLDLAGTYNNLKKPSAAADVLLALAASEPSEKVVVRCLRQLRRTERWSEMAKIIAANSSALAASLDFQVECAHYYAEGEVVVPAEAVQPQAVARLARREPRLAVELLTKVGRANEIANSLRQWLDEFLPSFRMMPDSMEKLIAFMRLFHRLGRREEFQKAIRSQFGEESERILEHIRASPRSDLDVQLW